MKRILIALLIACFLDCTILYAAAYNDIPDDANYKTAVEVLNSFNILTPQNTDDTVFEPDKAMTRGEYIQAIVNLMGIDTKSVTVKQYNLNDVTEETTYANAIYYAIDIGIISGYADKTFKPEANIKFGEAVKILVNVLGYKPYAENCGGFPTGYLVEASSLNLLSRLHLKADDDLKRRDAALLLFNSLEVDVMKLASLGANSKYAATKGENVLSCFLKSGVDDGILSQTCYTTLTDAEAAIKKDEVIIGGNVYKTGSTNAANLLGYRVKAYYRQEQPGGDKTLLYVMPYMTDAVKIEAENIAGYKNHMLTYIEDTETGKEINLKVSNKADVIYNGKAYPEYTENELLIKDGFLTLLDNNRDGVYDVILITEYEDYVVRSINVQDKIVYSSYPEFGKLDLSDVKAEDMTITDSEGSVLKMNAIKVNDVLTVKRSKDRLLIEMTVSSDQLKGTITERKDDENAEIDYLPYKIAQSYQAGFKNLGIGYKGTFLLDARGKIAGVLSEVSDGEKYGYLKRVVKQQGVDNDIQAQIFTTDGIMEIFTVSDTLTIDGNSNATSQNFYDIFTTVNPVTGARYTKQQLIKYQATDDKVLNFINSTTLGANEDASANLNLLTVSQTKYRSDTNVFGQKVILSSNTKIFKVPVVDSATPPEYSDTFDDSAFSVNMMSFVNNTAYDFDAYDVDDGGVCQVIVTKETYSGTDPIGGPEAAMVSTDNNDVIVDRLTFTTNADGELVPKLYFLEKGNIVGLVANKPNTLKKPVYDNAGNVIKNQGVYLQQGDIIRYKKNSKGEIVGIAVDFDISRPQFVMNSGAEAGVAYGMVYSQKNGGIRISTAVTSLEPLKFDFSNLYAYAAFRASISVYDTKEGKVRKGSITDIVDYKTDPANASLVFIHTKWDDIKDIFIFK